MNGKFMPGKTVFKMYADNGLPPEISVMIAHDKGFTIEWPSFISEAIRNGWKPSRTLTTILYAEKEADIFGQKELADFESMANKYFEFMLPKEIS